MIYDMDDYFAEAFNDESDFQEAEYLLRMKSWASWTTSQGEEILVRDMSSGHLENTIKYLKRIMYSETHKAWIEIMTAELESRK